MINLVLHLFSFFSLIYGILLLIYYSRFINLKTNIFEADKNKTLPFEILLGVLRSLFENLKAENWLFFFSLHCIPSRLPFSYDPIGNSILVTQRLVGPEETKNCWDKNIRTSKMLSSKYILYKSKMVFQISELKIKYRYLSKYNN